MLNYEIEVTTTASAQEALRETAASLVRAQWIAAQYRADGFQVTVTEQKPKEL